MRRILVLALALIAIFSAVAAIMLRFMPPPLKDSDYFVIGSVATMVSLLVIFLLIIGTSRGVANPFFKRRRK